MKKLNKDAKQGIRDACMAFKSEKSHDVCAICAEYAIALLENIDTYQDWFEVSVNVIPDFTPPAPTGVGVGSDSSSSGSSDNS